MFTVVFISHVTTYERTLGDAAIFANINFNTFSFVTILLGVLFLLKNGVYQLLNNCFIFEQSLPPKWFNPLEFYKVPNTVLLVLSGVFSIGVCFVIYSVQRLLKIVNFGEEHKELLQKERFLLKMKGKQGELAMGYIDAILQYLESSKPPLILGMDLSGGWNIFTVLFTLLQIAGVALSSYKEFFL